MAIAVDQNYDKAQRKISTANLEQFAGVDCQLLVEKETHRPIIMDGATVGGKFKCASTEELEAVETVANNAISKAYADEHYLGKTEKAVSASTADTAASATKATQDANGNVITDTYATKTEVTSGLSGKLGKTEKASSASTADSVAWTGVTGKPTFATVATSGSYKDLKDKPSIAKAWFSNSSTPITRQFKITRTNKDTYTATSDCFIDIRVKKNSLPYTSVYIYVNGIDYANTFQDMQENRPDDSLYVFLQKGNSIKGSNKSLSGSQGVTLQLYIYPLA